MSNRNVILGGGITGLVTALYFPNYSIITDEKEQEKKILGPKILRSTIYTYSFIKRFNIGVELKSYKCAYFTRGRFITKLDDDQKQEYIRKTRAEDYKPTGNELNDSINTIDGYDIRKIYTDISSRSSVKERIIYGRVTDISEESTRLVMKTAERIYGFYIFDKMINTIPFQAYSKLLGSKREYEESGIYFYLIYVGNMFKNSYLNGNDFVYYIDEEIPFYRISEGGSDSIVVESRVECTKEILDFICGSIQWQYYLPFGKVVQSSNMKSSKFISHLGRYSEGSQSLRLHDTIQQLEEKKVWKHQQ